MNLNYKIIDTYSKVHSSISYMNNENVSFEGSQKQKEFFEAWDVIQTFYKNSKVKKLSFLEIGAWKGLWGLAFMEFCKSKNIEGTYTTLTLLDHDPNNKPLLATLEYLTENNIKNNLIDKNTQDPSALKDIIQISNNYNIVFIDAGHTYEEVTNDINKFSNLATDVLLFHDIRPKVKTSSCGVYQAIQDSNIILDKEICYGHDNQMGIGIKFIK